MLVGGEFYDLDFYLIDLFKLKVKGLRIEIIEIFE